ncbi:MAG TPA: hypothetical protein PKB12_07215 [Elusimicrobiota bacterium]|nr:hypothetical protein [Elusimicrobiota bacterium]
MQKRWALFFLLATPVVGRPADSLYLELSSRGEKTDLGLAEITAEAGSPAAGKDFFDALKRDLEFPGLFTLIEGGPAGDGSKVPLEGWSRLGADIVAAGRLTGGGFGRPAFEGTLVDAGTGKILLTKSLPQDEDGRRTAHRWADEIIRYFTGQPGVASTRIVFANDATGKKEICVVDYDGTHFERLTNDRSIALFPKFSPDGEWIVFTSYKNGGPEVHVMRSNGKDRRAVCRYDGLNSAAAWAPDGKSLIATLSLGREPNLHQVDLDGRVIKTLTNSSAADTAPTLSPDGLRLAFTSDRPGPPQIYAMDTSGANLQRLTTEGQCDSPGWSPLGHLLAFTMSVKGNYDIYTLEVATGRTTRLTFGEGNNENAAWSPNGRHLVFTSSRRGRPELWVMNADGSSPRRLGNIPGRSFSPDWGR